MKTDEFLHYISFLHDGRLEGITCTEKNIEIALKSCELASEDNISGIQLDNNRLTGVLLLQNISSVTINAQKQPLPIGFNWDYGSIIEFEIYDKTVYIDAQLRRFPPANPERSYWSLKINSEQILWRDNQPDLDLNLTAVDTLDRVRRRGIGLVRGDPVHPEKGAGYRTLQDPETGDIWSYDPGWPAEPGHRSRDHWHHHNLAASGADDALVDANGIPCPDGSIRSVIYWEED